jgi:hypothetical protein
LAEELRSPPPQDLPELHMVQVRPEDVSHTYDKRTDMLSIRFGPSRPATSVDVKGIWFRIDPETGEIYGIEIEDFTEVFLAQQPELALAWREAHSRRTAKAQERSWLDLLLGFIGRMFGDGPNHPLLRTRLA